MATPKQMLVAHLTEHHKGIRTSQTLVKLRQMHARHHHQNWTDHYHEGINLGPGQRPPGWSTGEGVVVKVAR